jgi:hypothetical protein
MCDVYVYEDVNGGWTIHVAGARLKHEPPEELKAMPCTNVDEWIETHAAEESWRRSLPGEEYGTRDIDGEPGKPGWSIAETEYMDLSEISAFAGESFNEPSPGECADRLEEIRKSGLNVPQYAIDELREEENE